MIYKNFFYKVNQALMMSNKIEEYHIVEILIQLRLFEEVKYLLTVFKE